MVMKKLLVLLVTIMLIFVTVISGIACDVSDGNGNGTADTTDPIISGITISDITETTATISWTTNESTTSNIEYGPDTGYGHSFPSPSDNKVDKTSHSLALSGLSSDTTYHFKVKSEDATGNEAISNDITFVTVSSNGNENDIADTTAPIISGITISNITGTAATISWTTDESATSNIEYGPDTGYGYSFPSPSDNTADRTSHSLALSGLSSATTYHFKVKSEDATGNEAISNDKTFVTVSSGGNGNGIADTKASLTSVPVNMVYYGEYSAAIDEAIINANPEYLIGTSLAGPMKGNADINKFTTAGIKYFEYLTGGYEEKYPKTLPVDLQSNFDFIDAVAAAGGYGIFFDEVSDGIWTIPDYSYLQQISSRAHSLGLKVVFNTGVNNWVDQLMDYCDYISSTEQWSNVPLTASQQKWASRTWLLRREGINNAVTAANLTIGAWDKGVLAAYATSVDKKAV